MAASNRHYIQTTPEHLTEVTRNSWNMIGLGVENKNRWKIRQQSVKSKYLYGKFSSYKKIGIRVAIGVLAAIL